MHKKSVLLLLIIFGFIFLTSCKKKEESPEIKKWERQLLKKRALEDKEFKTSPTSPIAGLNRLTASPDKKNFIIFKEGKFELLTDKTDDALISVFQKDNKWTWEVFDKDFKCKSSGKPVESGKPLEGDIQCTYKRYSFLVYPLDSRLVLVSFDPERKELKEFTHRYYYPPNPEYRVKAKITRFQTPESVKMVTSQNLIKTFYRYARIDFEVRGQKRHLFAYKKDLSQKPGKSILFIPFKDKTNGKETYGAGRFLEIKEPVGDSFILDFNEAFNPLCNYAHVWNCSYPPSENILDIPIEAGEKTYPSGH